MAKCTIITAAPAINLTLNVKRDRMNTTRGNLNNALEVGHELGLRNRPIGVLTFAKAENTVQIATHGVNVAILRKQMSMGLTTCNRLDEDVIAAHTGHVNKV